MNDTIIYKGYEIYFDSSYYGMVTVRKKGCRDFNQAQQVDCVESAKKYIDNLLKNNY